jgi:hypothetical protein
MAQHADPYAFTPLEKELLTQGYALAYFLHPVKAIAREITIEAWDHLRVLDQRQDGRRRYLPRKRRNRTLLDMTGLFQQALCLVSDRWEQDQESGSPWRTANTYKPIAEDYLLRYVKFLLWKTMDRLPPYRALGLGCLLYTYAPQEVAAFTTEAWNSSNFRHVKGDLLHGVRERFPIATSTVPPYQEEKITGRSPNDRELDMITAMLKIFTAWRKGPGHPCPLLRQGTTTMRDLFRDAESVLQALAEDQKHALACPTCGGIPELVHDYNRHSRPLLPDPAGKLHIPLFAYASEDRLSPPDGPASAPDRSAPSPLEPHDWTAIAAALAEKQHRRDAYHGGVLRIVVDGQERQRVQTSQTSCVTFDLAAETAYIEVFGEDQHGEVLLAVFPFATLDAMRKRRQRVYAVTHAGGQRITMQVSAVQADNRPHHHIHLSYEEVPPPRVAALWTAFQRDAQHWWGQAGGTLERLWQRWGRNTWPNWSGLPVAYRRWSLVLAGVFLLSLGWAFGYFSARLRPATEHALSGNREVLFNAYQFQQGIRSPTGLGTLASAHAVLEEPPRLLGLAVPARRAMYVRAGVHYATLLAYLHSDDLAQATQHLDLLVQTLDTLPTSPVFTHYLGEMRTLLHSQQYSGAELGQFVGLFEPLFTAQYRGENGQEALTLMRFGTWLLNMSLAAAAGDKVALRQGQTAAYLEASLTRLNAPPAVLTMLQRVHDLITQQKITDEAVAEILELVKALQRMVSA